MGCAALPLLSCRSHAQTFPFASSYPPLLDHLVWLAGDLDAACAQFQGMTGITPKYGGRHPSGTHNALVALGPACYLEIAAPQPGGTSGHPWVAAAMARPEPHLYSYCMRSSASLELLADRAQAAGIKTLGPAPGSRTLPDGGKKRWRLLIPLVPGSGGCVPFFIEWGQPEHPAQAAPKGCDLVSFAVGHPDAEGIEPILSLLEVKLNVNGSSRIDLVAEITSPKGKVLLTG